MGKNDVKRETGGIPGLYHVQESGLEFKHGTFVNEKDKKTMSSETSSTTPQAFLAQFREDFEIRVLERPSPNDLVLELINVDTSFVNALRRILLSEVSTIAIEKVYIWENSSLLHDEVLAHRLGLIPINVDARRFEDKEKHDIETDMNTVVFVLRVACRKDDEEVKRYNRLKQQEEDNDAGKNKARRNDNDNEDDEFVTKDKDLYAAAKSTSNTFADTMKSTSKTTTSNYCYDTTRPYTKHVYSSDLVWDPQGDQEEMFENGIRPVYEDILIAKLRPGQSIHVEAHARKGIGKDHAKFSPVSTASYRLTPHIEILEPIYDELAEELVHVYEPGVFDLIPTDKNTDPSNTRVKAVVVNPYACTMSRNYMQNPILDKSIRMSRHPNRFIFSIESVGMYQPGVLLAEAIRVLQYKCQHVMDLIDQQQSNMVS